MSLSTEIGTQTFEDKSSIQDVQDMTVRQLLDLLRATGGGKGDLVFKDADGAIISYVVFAVGVTAWNIVEAIKMLDEEMERVESEGE